MRNPETSVTNSVEKISSTGVKDVTILMPIGGKATRAQEITHGEIPKHLIRVDGGQTVLDLVCKSLQKVGFRRFIFCVGNQKDQIEEHLGTEEWIESSEVSYRFSPESEPLGPDGAILQAIAGFALHGQGMIIPGDMMLPWSGLARMCERHMNRGSDITVGVTSCITERTTDVGRMVIDESDRMLRCFDRTERLPTHHRVGRALTSAAAIGISIERYVKLCGDYLTVNPDSQDSPIGFRDQILPWAIANEDFTIHAFDVEGEALDLGTPANIRYGQKNWHHYA